MAETLDELLAAVRGAATRFVWWRDQTATGWSAQGHAYLMVQGDTVLFRHFVDSGTRHPLMNGLIERCETEQPSGTERRAWWPPWSRYSLWMDAGAVRDALGERAVRHELILGHGELEVLEGFPEAFLRAPVATWVRHLVGPVRWPERLETPALVPGITARRSERACAVIACRPGSQHSTSGQNRTAVVLISSDNGSSWDELPWALPREMRESPFARISWPPEEICVADFVTPEALRIEWEDPWVMFDPPGSRWEALWDPVKRLWRHTELEYFLR